MSREMFAAKIEPDIEPEEEFFGPDQREELRLLRIEQMNMKGKFPGDKLERFLKLQDMEKEAGTGSKPLSAAEFEEYRSLSKMDKYDSPEQSARFVALQNRLEKAGREKE